MSPGLPAHAVPGGRFRPDYRQFGVRTSQIAHGCRQQSRRYPNLEASDQTVLRFHRRSPVHPARHKLTQRRVSPHSDPRLLPGRRPFSTRPCTFSGWWYAYLAGMTPPNECPPIARRLLPGSAASAAFVASGWSMVKFNGIGEAGLPNGRLRPARDRRDKR